MLLRTRDKLNGQQNLYAQKKDLDVLLEIGKITEESYNNEIKGRASFDMDMFLLLRQDEVVQKMETTFGNLEYRSMLQLPKEERKLKALCAQEMEKSSIRLYNISKSQARVPAIDLSNPYPSAHEISIKKSLNNVRETHHVYETYIDFLAIESGYKKVTFPDEPYYFGCVAMSTDKNFMLYEHIQPNMILLQKNSDEKDIDIPEEDINRFIKLLVAKNPNVASDMVPCENWKFDILKQDKTYLITFSVMKKEQKKRIFHK